MNRFRKKRNQKGFTMIELMVVVVIVGILAAIAIPIYGKYVKQARTTEATGRMGEMITAAKAWAQEKGTWPTQQEFSQGLGILDPTETPNFTYAITGGGGADPNSAFQITATGRDKMDGVTVIMDLTTINDNGEVTVTEDTGP
jgi:prepilin-type N-terminal cleavage/methylation domain-containing protein